MSEVDVVKPRTVARVRKAIAELGYVPNSNARMLGRGRSSLFGVIISDITNPFFPDLIHTFNELALQHKYRAVFAYTNYDPERMEASVQSMLEQNVEGIAIMTSEMSPHLVRRIADRRIPMVFLDEPVSQKNMSSVVVDYKSGMDQAIDHISALGHKNIAFISGPQNLRSAALRKSIFLEALREKKINMSEDRMTLGNQRVDGGYAAMQKLLQLNPRPTAVIASNDLSAIGAISAIYEAGLQVPRDISVVGFDDIEISSAFNPPLTTVRLSRTEIATRAFFALFESCNSLSATVKKHSVPTQLVIRRSTAPPAC